MASSSRSNRSAIGGNGTPSARCSRSYQAAPMPRKARPSRQHVERRDDLRQKARVPVGHARDEVPSLTRSVFAGDEAEGGVALEHRVVGGAELLHLEVVVHHGEPAGARPRRPPWPSRPRLGARL